MNSVPLNKSIYLSAERGLFKAAPSQINCPSLLYVILLRTSIALFNNKCIILTVLDQTVESFWNLVSKDRYPKLKDFALSMHWMFGKHTCVRVQNLRWSESNLKTETLDDSRRLANTGTGLLIKDDSVRDATGADPDSKVRGAISEIFGSQVS